MENQGVSGNDLASRLGVNISQVSRWRNGHTLPTLRYIDLIAHVFGVDPQRLALLAGRMPPTMTRARVLEIPEPKVRVQRVHDALSAIRGLTPKQRAAMLAAYKKTIKENR
jgi:transcriptional regulator with XRE-family HTH domain